jgi:hypothetical protein
MGLNAAKVPMNCFYGLLLSNKNKPRHESGIYNTFWVYRSDFIRLISKLSLSVKDDTTDNKRTEK